MFDQKDDLDGGSCGKRHPVDILAVCGIKRCRAALHFASEMVNSADQWIDFRASLPRRPGWN